MEPNEIRPSHKYRASMAGSRAAANCAGTVSTPRAATMTRRRANSGRRRVIVAARGVLTVPAQFAAALEPAIDALYLCDGLISFGSIAGTEVYKYPLGNFVMNLLAHTDL